jgi:amino acid adenylation domain-containing protein
MAIIGGNPGRAGVLSVLDAYARVVAETPGRTAVRGEAGEVSYAELDARSRTIAGGLRARGIGPGDRVVLALPRGIDQIAAMLGVVRCGGVYVPVDPGWPERRREVIVSQCEPGLVICGRDGAWGEPLADLQENPGEPVGPDATPAPDDPIYIMFTSGTTGVPKGVVVPHRAVARLVLDPDFLDVGPDRVWLHLASTSFDAATLELWTPLVRGAAIAPVEEELPTLDRIASVIEQREVTDAWITASLFNAMVDLCPEAFAGMRQVLTGGERLSPTHVSRFLERWPGLRLINGYGPTENTTFTCCRTISLDDARRPNGIPIGSPIRGTAVRIVDAALSPVPEGEAGELLAGGDGVALGYLNDTDLTNARFVEIPGETGLWYRTGDRAERAPDGCIEFLGRIDRQVKIRGHRIELEEVETLLRRVPGVLDAYACAIGERADERRLAAAITTDADAADAPSRVRRLARQIAPDYLVPDLIRVIERAPIGPNGKADRDAIARLMDPRETEPRRARTNDDDEWNTLRESIRAALPGADPGPDDGFIAVGGHSIAALRIAALIRDRTGRELPIDELLSCARLADLLPWLRTDRDANPTAGEPESCLPDRPPASSIQRQFYFENAVDPTGVAYHEHAGFAVLAGDLDHARLERAFRRLIARHEALRTRLVLDGGQLIQAIDPPEAASDARVCVHAPDTWPGVGDDAQDNNVPDWVARHLAVPFDLECDLPARLDVFPTTQGPVVVTFTFQHAAIDEWSLGIIQDELATLYEDPDALPDLAPSYRAFSERERVDVARVEARDLDRFIDSLVGAGVPRIDLGRTPAESVMLSGTWLDENAVRFISARLAVTPTALLAGLYAAAVGDVLGLSRVELLTPISRRFDARTQLTVGCCNVMRPLVVDARSTESRASLEQTIRNAADEILAAYRAEPVPYERVAQELRRRGVARGVSFGFAHETRAPFCPKMPGLTTEAVPVRTRIARFPLGLTLDRRGGRLVSTLSAPRGGETRFVIQQVAESMTRALAVLATGDEPSFRGRRDNTAITANPTACHASGTGERGTTGTASTEHRIATSRAWKAVVGVEPGSDGARFFESGGHSLMLLRLSARLRADTGVEIPLGVFLDDPTFGGLLRILGERAAGRNTSGPGFQIEEFGTGARVVIGIPGAFGHPIAFRRLADEFARRNAGIRLRCYNVFDAMSGRRVTEGFSRVLTQLANDFEREETVGMFGYCAGGLYPMFLASLPESRVRKLRLWLLNVFAPDRPGEGAALRLQSLRDAALEPRRLPAACRDSLVTAGRIAMARAKGRDRQIGEDQFSHAELRAVLTRRELRSWRGPATVIVAGRKPLWRSYYRNDRLNGLADNLLGPTRLVVLPVLHHELLDRGAEAIATEMIGDLGEPAA